MLRCGHGLHKPHVLKWLLGRGMPHVALACKHALHKGQLGSLRVLESHGLLHHCDFHDLFKPAGLGDLEVTQLVLPYLDEEFKAYRLLCRVVRHGATNNVLPVLIGRVKVVAKSALRLLSG